MVYPGFPILVSMFIGWSLRLQHSEARAVTTKRSATNNNALDSLYRKFVDSSPAKISHYGSYPVGTSACSLDPIPPMLSQRKWVLAGVSKDDFIGSLVCGTCLKISVIDLTTNADPEIINAAVVDQCNDCEKGEISLYTDGREKKKANVEAVDCVGAENDGDLLRAVAQQYGNTTAKIQIKNSMLPVVGLEYFINGKWVCLPRDVNNYFHIEALDSQHEKQFRATSLTGEKVGFSLDDLLTDGETVIKHQFSPFHVATRAGHEPSIKCHGQRNLTAVVSRDSLSQVNDAANIDANSQMKEHRSKSTGAENNANLSERHEKFANANQTSSLQAKHNQVNDSYCKDQSDGTYSNENNCQQFIICVQGRTLRKTCPNGLKYNAKESVCDWPKNVDCLDQSNELRSIPNSNTIGSAENDDEVYTKKFMKRKDSKDVTRRSSKRN